MANPNIVAVTSIYGKTTYYTPSGTAAVDTTVSIYSNGAIAQGGAPAGGVAYPIVSTVSVPNDSSLIVTDKTTAIYLEEGNSISVTSGTASGITYSISYEDIT